MTEASGNVDTATRLAYERTELALDRNAMATDRTLGAWIRTALSMISFGFTLGKLGQALHDVEIKGIFRTHTWGIAQMAYFLVILGTVSLLGAAVQHWVALRELRAKGQRTHRSLTFVIAILLTALGGFAFSALVLQL